jgi:hypothetical protein
MTWDFLHRWYMPFIWIALSSAVSVPLAVYFELQMPLHSGSELGLAYGSTWVTRDDFLSSIVPYLLGLGAIIWLFNADGSTRWAAFWATLIALGRIVVPVALATTANVTVGGNLHYVDWESMRILIWFQDFEMFALGVIVWTIFAHFVGSGNGAPAGAHAEAY